jgi:hypothetical protein
MRDKRKKQRKNFMKKLLFVGLISIVVLAFFGCDSDPKNARLEVWLTDAPGDYKEVNVEIIGVEVHSESGEQNSGWKSLNVEGGVYNLLELTNGLDTLLGTIEIPAGQISQIRLKLGNENTIKVGEQMHDLSTPSGQQSGLKLQVHEVLTEGITYKILLDFDVARSIVNKGNETYSLKPVIRTITEAQDGAIKGVVIPIESTPAVYAITGTDTVTTTYTNEAGQFLLRGLDAGSYKIVFLPNSSYDTLTVDNVNVTIGNVTDMGEVTIVP